MKEHKIFKPDMVFQDFIKSCWCQNIKTLEGKIPINSFLKEKGIFALDINPNSDSKKEVYTFGLPVNKNWEPQVYAVYDNAYLCFEIYSEITFSIDVLFQDSKGNSSSPTKINIGNNDTDKWSEFHIPVTATNDLRLILFSGSTLTTPNYVIRNIVVKTDEI